MTTENDLKDYINAAVNLNSGKQIDKSDIKCTPVELDELTPSKATEENFKKQETGCADNAKKKYDIIYVPAHQKFWLMPQEVLDVLNESSAVLYDSLTAVTPVGAEQSTEAIKAQRMRALSQSGLMDFFVSPDFRHFLSPEDRKKYEQTKINIESMDQAKKDTLESYSEKFASSVDEDQVTMFCRSVNKVLASYAVEAIAWVDQKLSDTDLEPYIKKAQKNARSQGYIIDQDGAIYSKQQIAISELLQKYVESRKQIEADEIYTETGKLDVATSIIDYLQEYKKEIDADHWYTTYAKQADYFEKQTQYSEYLYQIYELARLGIAVPEFALTPTDKNTSAGVQRMYNLTQYRKERQEILTILEEEFTKWLSALGQSGIAPPQDIFDPYMRALAETDKKLEALYRDAEINLSKMKTPRLLIWEPESYKPKREDTLIKDSMPMREYVASAIEETDFKSRTGSSTSSRHFRQFSLFDLANKLNNKTTAFYKAIEAVKKELKSYLPKPGKLIEKSISATTLESDDDLFLLFLKTAGCEEIEIDNDWFKDNIFQYQDFFDYLKEEKAEYHIATLENDQAKEKLGQELQGILFQNTLFTRLMKFDHGAGAQLVRLIQSTYPGENGHPAIEAGIQSEMTGPTLKSPGVSGNIGLVISNGRGTVSLGEIYFPLINTDPEKYGIEPYELQIDYKNIWNQTKILDLGKIYLKISATAAGFSGASFMLSGEAALYSDKTGVSLTTIDRTTGEASKEKASGTTINAQASAFIGASATVTGEALVAWYPPRNVLTNFSEFYAKRDPKKLESYKTLAKLELVLGALAGMGAEFNFSIGLVKNRLHVTVGAAASAKIGLKGSLSFEVDYTCIWQLIHIVNQAIKENDNNPLNFVTNEASSLITQYILVGLSSLTTIVVLGAESVKRIYDSVISLGSDGSTSVLASRIVENQNEPVLKKWLDDLPPRVLAVLIYNLFKQYKRGVTYYKAYKKVEVTFGGRGGYTRLSATGRPQYLDESVALCDHQEAILICLQAIDRRKERSSYDLKASNGEIIPNAAQAIFEEVILRLSSDGEFPFPVTVAQEQQDNAAQMPKKYIEAADTNRLNSYCTNLAELNVFMNTTPSILNGGRNIEERHDKIRKAFTDLVLDLGKRMATACKPNQTEVDKFLAGKALRLENLRGKTITNPLTVNAGKN